MERHPDKDWVNRGFADREKIEKDYLDLGPFVHRDFAHKTKENSEGMTAAVDKESQYLQMSWGLAKNFLHLPWDYHNRFRDTREEDFERMADRENLGLHP